MLYIRIMEIQNNPAVASKDMLPEERLEALSEVLAEGFLYLAEKGLLENSVEPSTRMDDSIAASVITGMRIKD